MSGSAALDSAVRDLNDPGGMSNRINSNRTLSTFELLPLEILEKIFFYSLNVNLPRASPSLAALFSNERIYRLLILLAFWDNDYDYDQHYNTSEGKDVFGGDPARYGDFGTYTWRENRLFNIPWILRPLGHDYVRLSSDERRMLQSGIWTCRWCTNERIRRQLPDLGRLIIARWCINAGYIFEDERVSRKFEGILHSEKREDVNETAVVRVKKECPEQHGEEEEEDRYPRCSVIVAAGEFVKFLFEFKGKEDDGSIYPGLHTRLYSRNIVRWFPVLSILTIPPHLFQPDFRSDHLRLSPYDFSGARLSLLNTLRLSGQLMTHSASGIPPEVTYSRNALLKGILAALSTLNIRALDMLLSLDCFLCADILRYYMIPPGFFVLAAELYIRVAELRKKHINSPDQSEVELTEGLTITEGSALLSFHFLLVCSAESLPCDDPAVRQVPIAAGGEYGMWLSNLMEMLPQHVEELKRKEDSEVETVFVSRLFNHDFNEELEIDYRTGVFAERSYLSIPEEWFTEDLVRYDLAHEYV